MAIQFHNPDTPGILLYRGEVDTLPVTDQIVGDFYKYQNGYVWWNGLWETLSNAKVGSLIPTTVGGKDTGIIGDSGDFADSLHEHVLEFSNIVPDFIRNITTTSGVGNGPYSFAQNDNVILGATNQSGNAGVIGTNDGINWREMGYDDTLNIVCQSILYLEKYNRFVRLRYNTTDSTTYLYYSEDDGETWIRRLISPGTSGLKLAYSPELDVLIFIGSTTSNQGGRISYDGGINWNTMLQSPSQSVGWSDVIWVSKLKKFIAVGTGGNFTSSADGNVWDSPVVIASIDLDFVTYIESINRIFTYDTQRHYYYLDAMVDGASWVEGRIEAGSSVVGNPLYVPSLNKLFLCGSSISPGQDGIRYTSDGINWNIAQVNTAKYPFTLRGMIYSNKLKQLISGTTASQFIYSATGEIWYDGPATLNKNGNIGTSLYAMRADATPKIPSIEELGGAPTEHTHDFSLNFGNVIPSYLSGPLPNTRIDSKIVSFAEGKNTLLVITDGEFASNQVYTTTDAQSWTPKVTDWMAPTATDAVYIENQNRFLRFEGSVNIKAIDLCISDDEGNTWRTVSLGTNSGKRICYSEKLNRVLFNGTYAGNSNGLYSDNAGDNWTLIPTPPDITKDWQDTIWIDELNSFISVSKDGCYSTSDTGLVWSSAISLNIPDCTGIAWIAGLQKAIAFGNNNFIAISNTNNLNNWTVADGVAGGFVSMAWSDKLKLIAATAVSTEKGLAGVVYSLDGNTWLQPESFPRQTNNYSMGEITWSNMFDSFILGIDSVGSIDTWFSKDGKIWVEGLQTIDLSGTIGTLDIPMRADARPQLPTLEDIGGTPITSFQIHRDTDVFRWNDAYNGERRSIIRDAKNDGLMPDEATVVVPAPSLPMTINDEEGGVIGITFSNVNGKYCTILINDEEVYSSNGLPSSASVTKYYWVFRGDIISSINAETYIYTPFNRDPEARINILQDENDSLRLQIVQNKNDILDIWAAIENLQPDINNAVTIIDMDSSIDITNNGTFTVSSTFGGRINGEGYTLLGLLSIKLVATGYVDITLSSDRVINGVSYTSGQTVRIYDNTALIGGAVTPLVQDLKSGDIIQTSGMQSLIFTPYIAKA